MERLIESTVSSSYEARRLDYYLSKRFTYLSRTEWQKEILSGKIFINGKSELNCHKRLRMGDSVKYSGRNIPEPPVEEDYSVLYEDEFIIGIDKPANLPVHPSGRYFNNTLLMMLQTKYRKKFFPVHRLDRETSGVILMAKSAGAASAFQKKFSHVKKTYITAVYGKISENHFIVDTPIGLDSGSQIRKKRLAYPGAPEKARTFFKKIFCFDRFTLVKAVPETGRLHQIRVHLKFAGYPIVGDKLYGPDENLYLDFVKNNVTPEMMERLLMPRCALHSRSLCFPHPDNGKIIYIKAPLPADIKEFITGRN